MQAQVSVVYPKGFQAASVCSWEQHVCRASRWSFEMCWDLEKVACNDSSCRSGEDKHTELFWETDAGDCLSLSERQAMQAGRPKETPNIHRNVWGVLQAGHILDFHMPTHSSIFKPQQKMHCAKKSYANTRVPHKKKKVLHLNKGLFNMKAISISMWTMRRQLSWIQAKYCNRNTQHFHINQRKVQVQNDNRIQLQTLRILHRRQALIFRLFLSKCNTKNKKNTQRVKIKRPILDSC